MAAEIEAVVEIIERLDRIIELLEKIEENTAAKPHSEKRKYQKKK